MFIHDDAALTPISVEKMVARIMSDPETAIVGPKIMNWDDEDILEEVGMAADRFGYPYKGLEEGEIDLGQHDRASEVFFVTSTCMLVKHGVFRQLRGWDARMRAFSEDLDLCWRARIAGHSVRFEPEAKARHAIALATGKRTSPYVPTRYFIRRNRLRAVTKNASAIRLLTLIPLFVLLSIAEMIGFIIIRQPREIWNLIKALGWNAARLPQTLAERRRVQHKRRVPDSTISRYTVRLSTRIRSYLGNQTQRIEEAWGRRAEVLSQRGHEARAFGQRMKGWPIALTVLAVMGFLIGFRHILWAEQASVGELLPFPDGGVGMWKAYIAPWNHAGLGGPGPNPPAFAILGFIPMLTFGAAATAQKVMVLGLGAVAAWGAYRLVYELVDPPARWVSAATYGFGAVGYAGLREGRLGAMFFAAAAPFVLAAMIRLIGWARPPEWRRNQSIARIALGGAVSAAFVPGSLLLYAIAAVMLFIPKLILDHKGETFRPLFQCFLGLFIAWALLLPWSASWFSDGGALDTLFAGDTWRGYANSFRGDGMASTLLGQTPDGPALFGLAMPLLGIIAVAVADGARRRMALALWTVVVAMGWIVDLISAGVLRPLVPSPTEVGVLASLAFAGLAGIAVGAFRLDLSRRELSWRHAASVGALALSGFLIAAGIGPALWRGEWNAGETAGGVGPEVVAQVSSLLDAEAQQTGAFRALWIGSGWSSREPTGARPGGDSFLTGAREPQLQDLFTPQSDADGTLDVVIASIEEGTTDRGGELLGAFNVHFVIIEDGPRADGWLAQRDLALIRTEDDYFVLRNQVELPRAGVYSELPVYVRALEESDPKLSAGAEIQKTALSASGSSGYRGQVGGGGVVFLATSEDGGWKATADNLALDRVPGGWGNAYALEEGSSETQVVEVTYPRSIFALFVLLITILAWIATVGAAVSRKRRKIKGTIA